MTPELTTTIVAWRFGALLFEGVSWPNTAFPIDNGSFGATPKYVVKSQRNFADLFESQPIRFFVSHFRPWMVAALRRLAPFVKAPSAESLVFVDNATSGVLSAVTSQDWKQGDSLLYLNIGYGPIIKYLKTYSEKMGFKLIEVKVGFLRFFPEKLLFFFCPTAHVVSLEGSRSC